MAIRAIRGATTVEADEAEQIKARASELFFELLDLNSISSDDVISIFLTTTADVTAAPPAAGIREAGIVDIPLLCTAEMPTAQGLPLCIRMMVHVESDIPRADIRHAFLQGTAVLRPDLFEADGPNVKGGGRDHG